MKKKDLVLDLTTSFKLNSITENKNKTAIAPTYTIRKSKPINSNCIKKKRHVVFMKARIRATKALIELYADIVNEQHKIKFVEKPKNNKFNTNADIVII